MSALRTRSRALLDAGFAASHPTDADRSRNRKAIAARIAVAAAAGAAATSVPKTAAAAGAAAGKVGGGVAGAGAGVANAAAAGAGGKVVAGASVAYVTKLLAAAVVVGAASGGVLVARDRMAAERTPTAITADTSAMALAPPPRSPSPSPPVPAPDRADERSTNPPPIAPPPRAPLPTAPIVVAQNPVAPITQAPAKTQTAEVPTAVAPESRTTSTAVRTDGVLVPVLPPESSKASLDLLKQARAALEAGSPRVALTLAAEHAHRYPQSSFAEERAAVRVLALCNLAHIDEALSEGMTFLKRYPSSPYKSRVSKCIGAD